MAPNSGNTKNLANLAGPHNFMDGNAKRLGDVYPEFGKGQPCGSVLAEFTGAIKIIADKIENEDLSGFDIKRLKSWYNIFTRFNINVNAVAPGFIDTPMTENIPDTMKKEILQSIPLGRPGTPEDVAKVVKFLCTEDSAYMTGQVISCNGGMYLQ